MGVRKGIHHFICQSVYRTLPIRYTLYPHYVWILGEASVNQYWLTMVLVALVVAGIMGI